MAKNPMSEGNKITEKRKHLGIVTIPRCLWLRVEIQNLLRNLVKSMVRGNTQ